MWMLSLLEKCYFDRLGPKTVLREFQNWMIIFHPFDFFNAFFLVSVSYSEPPGIIFSWNMPDAHTYSVGQSKRPNGFFRLIRLDEGLKES